MDEMQPVVMENKGFDTLEKPKVFTNLAPISVTNASDARNRSQYDIYEGCSKVTYLMPK